MDPTLPQIAVSSLVKTIKAHLEKAKQAQDRSEQHYISAGLHLAELKDRYKRDVKASKTQTWEVYVRETFGLGRSRADELIRIADGRATLEDTRAVKAASVAKSKAKVPKTAASSGGSGSDGSATVFAETDATDAEPAQAEGTFPVYFGSCHGGRVVTERTSTKPKVNAAGAPGLAPQTNFDESKPTEFDDNIDPKELGRTLERALEDANAFSNWSKREPIPERRKKRIAKQVEAMREVVSEFHRLLRWEPRRQKKLNDDSARAPVSTTPAAPPVGDELDIPASLKP